MNRAWIVVYLKEMLENARDRRVLMSALLYGPLIGPVLFAVMISFILANNQDEAEKPLELPVVGAEHAPNLVDHLRQRGVVVLPPPDNAEAAIADQQVHAVLRVPVGYGEALRAGRPAELELLFDGSRQKSRIPVDRTRRAINAYGAQLGAQRLLLRGIDPAVGMPLALHDRDQSTEQARAAMVLAMLPYMLILAAFIGGMYLAIDTTSGERERRSLEPLFLSPAGRGEILAGKVLATTTYASASLTMAVLALAICVSLVPTEDLGMSLAIPAPALLRVLVATLPIALFAAVAQTLVASFARSFREAQTYVQFLMFVPMVPTFVLIVNPIPAELWMTWVPLFSQSLLINMLARGEAVETLYLVASVVGTVLGSGLLAIGAWWQFTRERFVFGT